VTGVTSHIVAYCQLADSEKSEARSISALEKLDQSLRWNRSWAASEPFRPLSALKAASAINGLQ
jgi:hypothetical protein